MMQFTNETVSSGTNSCSNIDSSVLRYSTQIKNAVGPHRPLPSTGVPKSLDHCGLDRTCRDAVLVEKVTELKRKFHTGRLLQMKNLPSQVSEKEIRDLLIDFRVLKIFFILEAPGHAAPRAVVEFPEILDDFDPDRSFLLRGSKVLVSVTNTINTLCVSRLPLTYTDTQFSTLVQTYGHVNNCYLMISEETGESKGYGFVQYASKEIGGIAKDVLNRKQVENSTLCCDWIDPNHIKLESLHSECLYIDGLPKDFRNMEELRQLISSVVPPSYCQIALKNGCPQNWGLAEFRSSLDAEKVQKKLDGCNLRGQNIRMHYCTPGIRAINLYVELLKNSNHAHNEGKGAGLLPTPSFPAVLEQFQSLDKHTPAFAESLRKIIRQQTQGLYTEGNYQTPPPSSVPTPLNHPNANNRFPPANTDMTQNAMFAFIAAQNNTSSFGQPRPLVDLRKLVRSPPPSPTHKSNPHIVDTVEHLYHSRPKVLDQQTKTDLPWETIQNKPNAMYSQSDGLFDKFSHNQPPYAKLKNRNLLDHDRKVVQLGSSENTWTPFAVNTLMTSNVIANLIEQPLVERSVNVIQTNQFGWVNGNHDLPLTMQDSFPTISGFRTPVGQKRKNVKHLPSPEPSPEGNYIGQHSQGIGGHYADSYSKRKKMNN